MFQPDDMDNDRDLKDSILQELIEHMEDVMSGRLKPAEKGLAVEVQAPDKQGLQEGIEKAHDVLNKAPDSLGAAHGLASAEPEKSDDERLAELMEDEGGHGDDDDDEDEDEGKC